MALGYISPMLMRLALLLACASVAACSNPDGRPKVEDRVKWAQEQADKPPSVIYHRMDRGELLKIEVPVKVGKTLVERQTCFVWRDAEYRTASLQCPSDATMPTPGGPEPDAIYRP